MLRQLHLDSFGDSLPVLAEVLPLWIAVFAGFEFESSVEFEGSAGNPNWKTLFVPLVAAAGWMGMSVSYTHLTLPTKA